jgi:predicted O-linked N-acetylglucosamine transferase (SPINDLY family)
VLIDLHGLSSGARPGIFALHPAPKQGTYIGFIGTTGMPWFDFVIADKYVLPEELTKYFTEKPLYVEGSFIPLAAESEQARTATRVEFDLPENAFVMAAFGNVYKLNERIVKSWFRVLNELPQAVLWLMDDNDSTTNMLKKIARSCGIGSQQIVFTKRAAHIEYRAKLALADVFLDSFPYNCGSTTRDVLNAGVPMVTLSGNCMVSRMGGSILSSLDLSELIANDEEKYESLIIDLAKDQSRRLAIKQKLNQNLARIHGMPNRMTHSIEKQLLNFKKYQN